MKVAGGVVDVSNVCWAERLHDRPVGPRVTAVDPEPGNGTVLEREGSRRPPSPGEPVVPREQGRRVPADVVALRLSGQRHFSDERRARTRPGTAGGGLTVLG